MINSATRDWVWQSLLDAARLSRYYQKVETKFRKCHFGIRFLLLLSAMAGIAPLVSESPGAIPTIGAAGIAVLVVLDFMMDYSTKISTLHSISVECGSLEGKWHGLWAECDLPEVREHDIRQKCRELIERSEEITSMAGAANIRVYEKLNQDTAEEANQVIRDRYEPATKRAYSQG